MRFGISNVHNFDSITLLWAVDAVSPMDNAEYVNTGLEIMFFNRAYLRSGLSSLFLPNSESVLNLGAGVELNLFGHHGLQLDYAYEVMRYLNDVHKFSLSINRWFLLGRKVLINKYEPPLYPIPIKMGVGQSKHILKMLSVDWAWVGFIPSFSKEGKIRAALQLMKEKAKDRGGWENWVNDI